MRKVKEETLALSKEKKRIKNLYMYILLLPGMILTGIFCYLPLAGVIMAFQDFDILKGFFDSPWVGLKNFEKVLTTRGFLDSIKNTVIYSSVLLFGKFPFPIILALMFNEIRNAKFKKITQTISYFPHFLSWTAVCGILYSMFALEGPYNELMRNIVGEGWVNRNILMESRNFLTILFTSSLWKEIGWSSIIYLAAIAGIDASLYEAAEIDGANRLQRAWHITVPCIRETMVLLLILGLGSLFSSNFDAMYGLQNAYTQTDTETIATIVYRSGIQGGKYSLTTALGLMQGLVSFALVFLGNRISRKIAGYGVW